MKDGPIAANESNTVLNPIFFPIVSTINISFLFKFYESLTCNEATFPGKATNRSLKK
jgi:hypothetical protein